jgi:mannitol/fructose-specific phosphotransferase system IIA component (Ntr-type)
LSQGQTVITTPDRSADDSGHPDGSDEEQIADRVALTDVFTSECIETLHSSSTKVDVIRGLVQLLVKQDRLPSDHAEAIIGKLVGREGYGSSAIGKGLAFPHLRTIEVQKFVGAIGVAPEGIHFESLDHEPTKLVFLTLSPLASRRKHINLLSRLVGFMRDKVMNMQMNHPIKPQDIYQYLHDLDDQSGVAGKS